MQLARMAGVSRQAISFIESGQSEPSLRVALSLARGLGLTVEELFGPGAPPPYVRARLVAPLGIADSRVNLAQVGGAFVALPLSGSAVASAGFLPASGVVHGVNAGDTLGSQSASPEGEWSELTVQPVGPPRSTLVVAGSEPALPLLEPPLGLLDPRLTLSWWPCGSDEAIRLAMDGRAHAASICLRRTHRDDSDGPMGELLRGGAKVIAFCSWRSGVVMRREVASAITDVADLRRSDLRLISITDRCGLTESELAGLKSHPGPRASYAVHTTGHMQVAAAVAAGLADAAIAGEPAALAYGLAFMPMATVRSDLLVPPDSQSSTVRTLLRILSSPWLADQLGRLPGYDTSHCGEQIA